MSHSSSSCSSRRCKRPRNYAVEDRHLNITIGSRRAVLYSTRLNSSISFPLFVTPLKILSWNSSIRHDAPPSIFGQPLPDSNLHSFRSNLDKLQLLHFIFFSWFTIPH